MKKAFCRVLAITMMAIVVSVVITSCNNPSKDAVIKAEIEKALKDDPMAVKVTVDVKDGVATLSGECIDDKSKERCTMRVETVVGVKSVVNNCTVLQKTEMSDDALNKQLYELSKDLPYIKIGAMDGVVAVAGGMTKKEWETLKAGIDKLSPNGYDTAMLNIQ